MQDNETFLPVKGYEGLYEISNHGRVKSLRRYRKGVGKSLVLIPEHFLTGTINSDGYAIVRLCNNKKKTGISVHRIVAQHFIPNPLNKSQVNHIDSKRSHNHVSNLEWCTLKENMEHATKHGYTVKGIKQHNAFLTEQQVMSIFNSTKRNCEIAKEFSVSKNIVSNIKVGRTWKHVTGLC